MKILVVTQEMNVTSPTLGFFHEWVRMLSSHYESIEVICLSEGHHTLPDNVQVHSLGKEKGKASPVAYALRFISLVWRLRHNYDAILVHMNQEYVLLAGPIWKLLGKRIYMWRNHYAGSWLTDAAALFCEKVFCTSKHSYTAEYRKTVLMPVGVDTARFFPDARVVRKSGSILFLGRISPSKRPEMLIDALELLAREGKAFTATITGSPLPQDEAFYEGLKCKVRELNLVDRITFLPGIPNSQTPDLYRAHEIFVNASPSGMFDKTLFEAAASGCLVLAASDDFHAKLGDNFYFRNTQELAGRLRYYLSVSTDERLSSQETLSEEARRNGLEILMDKLGQGILIRS